MSIRIREAESGDTPQIARLSNELGYAATQIRTERWLADLLASSQHAVFVAVREDDVVEAWLVVERRLTLESGYKAVISGLVTGAAWRRLGLGKMLVEAACAWAEKEGLARLTVSSNVQRDEAHVFYQSLGFVREKTAHSYVRVLLVRS